MQRCSGYHPGPDERTLAEHGPAYARTYRDRTVQLGPYIARGSGAPTAVLRIHWYVDTDERVLVVGHVGGPLPQA